MKVLAPILATITPVSLRGLNIERGAATPDQAINGWDAVGAMETQKELLRETFLWPTRVSYGRHFVGKKIQISPLKQTQKV